MSLANKIGQLSRTKTTPIPVVRSARQVDMRCLTSLPAGKMVPIGAFPLLREDRVRSSNIRVSFELMETVETLMNAVNVSVKAYLVPNLALERFSGMDELNRSYEGLPNQEGGPVTAYFWSGTAPAPGSNLIHKYLGLHAKAGDVVNQAYVEAYNQIWNFRAKNRSKSLALRTAFQNSTLAPAFWQHDMFKHIVPDFDQAVIDGEVALNVVNSKMPVKGLASTQPVGTAGTSRLARESNETAQSNKLLLDGGTTNSTLFPTQKPGAANGVFEVYAELQNNGITVSLSNIELARKTQAFAEMRKQYGGHDDYIIDLLMDGISVPEQAFRQPILLASEDTVFGMAKRYATDGGNLTDSVVNGATFVDMQIATPAIPCGGVVMIVAEITPEQLWERQRDPYLYTTQAAKLPQYLRDTLDPEKVDIVTNGEIDTSHATPNGAFGYAPLNWKWSTSIPRVGGKFFRPEINTSFDEDRQRIWAVETANPTLSADFYLCNAIHTKPFVVTNQDIGESLTRGVVVIEGLTVFGGALVEANGDYAEVMAEAPQGRIVKA